MAEGDLTHDGDAPCFCAGTMIGTPSGAVAVERLEAGDLVLTADGRSLPVRRVGCSYVSVRAMDPLRCLPIRIKAGALAEGLPARDLLVSPAQALFFGGVLVQAGGLVNGISIIRETAMPDLFAYYHVELAGHELLLAEGVAVESFKDHADWMNDRTREMAYPRARSARQLPLALRRQIAARKDQLALSQMP